MTDTHQTPAGNSNVVTLPERIRDNPQRAVSDLVRDHPMLVVAGGLAIGVIVAALLPKGATRRMAAKAAGLAEIASAAGLAFGTSTLERAEAAGETLRSRSEDLGHSMSAAAGRARAKGGEAVERIERAIAPAGKRAGAAGHNIADRINDLTSRLIKH